MADLSALTIFTTPTVTLEFQKEVGLLIQTWTGYCSPEDFREAIDKTVSFVETHQVNSIISNTLKQRVVGADESAYAASSLPKLFQSGIKGMAFVMPESQLTQLSLKNFRDTPLAKANIKFISNIADALVWAKTVR